MSSPVKVAQFFKMIYSLDNRSALQVVNNSFAVPSAIRNIGFARGAGMFAK
jgi:hypothetical protein